MLDVSAINGLPRDDFLKQVNELFETAPPLAERLLEARPFSSFAALIDYAEHTVLPQLSAQDLLAVINAHPRIGANKTSLSLHSLKEQGYSTSGHSEAAPGSSLTATGTESAAAAASKENEDDLINAKLLELNNQYESKFGHRFVVFVNGRPRKDIIPVIQERLGNAADAELRTGLAEMMQIARDRLRKSGFQ